MGEDVKTGDILAIMLEFAIAGAFAGYAAGSFAVSAAVFVFGLGLIMLASRK